MSLRFRYLTGANGRPRIVNGHAFDLHPRYDYRLEPDPDGRPLSIELDLTVELQEGIHALLVPDVSLPSLGLRPVLGAIVRGPGEPVAPFTLLLDAPADPVDLGTDQVVARLLLLAPAPQRCIDDPALDEVLVAGDPLLGDHR